MTLWEKFISDILANYKKEDIICQYYLKLYGGNKGTSCSKNVPLGSGVADVRYTMNVATGRKIVMR